MKTKLRSTVVLALTQLMIFSRVHAGGLVAAWGDNTYGQTTLPAGVNDVKAISAGYSHSLALKSDGTVLAWGYGYYGEAKVPADLPHAVAVAAGASCSLILKPDGTVMAWGDNYYGEANVPAGLSNVTAIATSASGQHNLALRSDGTVVAWGSYSYGQTPATVPEGLSDVTAIAAGRDHDLALKADGTVVAWGDNSHGQTNVPAGLTNVVAISAGDYHNLALKTDGMIVAWGDNGWGQTNVPPGLSNVVAIAAGFLHNLALKADGTVVGWGYDYYGQTNVPSGLSNATAIAAAGDASFALVFSGPVQITQNPQSQTVYSPYTSNVIFSVAATGAGPLSYQWFLDGTALVDNSHVHGSTGATLTISGLQPSDIGAYSVVVSNALGQVTSSTAEMNLVGAPFIVSQPVSQSGYLGYSAAFSVSAKGSLPLSYQWRFDGADIPGATNATLTLTNLTSAQAGYYHVVVSNAFGQVISAKALLTLDTANVVVWGNNALTDLPLGLTNLVAVAGGYAQIVGLKSDGTIKVWTTPDHSSLTNIPPGATNVIAVAAGIDNFVLKSDGTIVKWGGFPAPTPAGLSNVLAIAEKDAFALVLKSNNTVIAWGNNSFGQTNVPPGLSNVVAIAAGAFHGLAAKADGSVVAWGDNQNGQTNVPAGLTNVIAVAGGSYHSLALKADGTVAAWGGFFPITNVPPRLSNVVAIAGGFNQSLALKADGSLTAWGGDPTFSLPPGLSNVFAVACGQAFYVALVGDGSPHITIQPMSQSLAAGANVQLHARAVGVQPMRYQWQWNGQILPGATNDDLTIAGAPGDYRMIAANALGAITSRVAQVGTSFPFITNLDAALNATNLVWSTFSYNRKQSPAYGSWFAENQVTHDGTAAAQSGAITNTEESTLQTTVTGPGTLAFWWKVSSEADYDFLKFYLDGANAAAISGEADWKKLTLTIPPGNHTLRWIYSKDASVSDGQDAGWLDQVTFTPASLFLSSPKILPDKSFVFAAGAVDGEPLPPDNLATFEVQASTNLLDWVTVPEALTTTNGMLQLRDPAAAGLPMRFYRIVQQQN
jgi:alpha-tubulin suppressor-like RCC1 family protein